MSKTKAPSEVAIIDDATGLVIVPERDNNLTEFSRKLLSDFYLKPGETPQKGFARASFAWSKGDRALAQRLYEGASRGWFMFASPVLSNAPEVATLSPLTFKKVKGLPISCFLSYVSDSLEGLIDHSSETRWLSVLGGGVGGHWSDVRAVSDKAPGPIPFLHTVDADMEAYKQGKVRRGSYAAYMDVSHPDIQEFINIRVPTGDASRKCHSAGFHHGVNITDDFMEAVDRDGMWELKDPNDNSVRETISARKLWEQILEIRYRTGEPYLYFIDAAKRALPKAQTDLGLTTHGSNLCSEISLVTSAERTAVCCLSSLNADTYDEWHGTTIVQDLTVMLDNVLDYFIENAPTPLHRAKYSAMRERAIGIGVMGFHHYLQKHMVPFESDKARKINKEMFSWIQGQAIQASLELGRERGECPDFITDLTITLTDSTVMNVKSSDFVSIKGKAGEAKRAFDLKIGDEVEYEGVSRTIKSIDGLHSHSGRRNSHLLSPAPNANSAILLGSSPGTEPNSANAYIHQTRAGSWPVKNKYLERTLESKDLNNEETWQNIIVNKGSIQHMDIFSDEEKEVFKTAIEINQVWVVTHAADRQPMICQSQSINLFFPPRASRNYFHRVHFMAWKLGMKSLYYTRTSTPNRADNISGKIARIALKDGEEIDVREIDIIENAKAVSYDNDADTDDGECLACQG